MTPFTSVLIVDDEPSFRELMTRWVESLGLQAVTAGDADEAVAALNGRSCDLAIIDVVMPGKNGLWLAEALLRDHPETAVVLATGNAATVAGPAPAIADFLVKPFRRDRFMLALDRGREWRRHAVEEIEWQRHLSDEVRDAIADIQAYIRMARAKGANEAHALCQLGFGRIRDVMEHSERVVRYALSIASELGLDVAQMPLFEEAARFHDIGKLAMPAAVLKKPSPLTPGEAAIMRGHVSAGADILMSTATLQTAAPVVLASHEWYSGSGYPQRLARAQIPMPSRIIAVADAYDAMTQDRCYRSVLDAGEAGSELLRSTPNQFDPDVVTAFLNILGRH